MKNFVYLLIIGILLSGCTNEEKKEAVTQATNTIEKDIETLGLKEKSELMVKESLKKIEEVYENEGKEAMDKAYVLGKETLSFISEKSSGVINSIKEEGQKIIQKEINNTIEESANKETENTDNTNTVENNE